MECDAENLLYSVVIRCVEDTKVELEQQMGQRLVVVLNFCYYDDDDDYDYDYDDYCYYCYYYYFFIKKVKFVDLYSTSLRSASNR